MASRNIYFGGKLIRANGLTVATDRLGSVRANSAGERFSYYPYGEERTSTADGREKFGTYFRDVGGVDYADQRYYESRTGRFRTPDPSFMGASNPEIPRSWNMYSYVLNDPVNLIDPTGLGCRWGERDPWGEPRFVCDGGGGGGAGGGGVGGGGVNPPPCALALALGSPDPLNRAMCGGDEGGAPDPGPEPPYYRTHPCDRNDTTNARIFRFMDAHRADAEELASQVNVPWEWILAVSAEETTYGTEGIVTKGTNNFFGLHVNDANDTSHYLYQIAVYKTTLDGYVATFAERTGFLDSGMGFISVEKPHIQGSTSVDAFPRAVHAHGYGVSNSSYVSDLIDVVGLIKAREGCPR